MTLVIFLGARALLERVSLEKSAGLRAYTIVGTCERY
jgi:hypothetical protein